MASSCEEPAEFDELDEEEESTSWWEDLRDHYFTIDRRTLGLTRLMLGFFLLFDLWRRTDDWWKMFSTEGVLPNHFNLFRPQSNGWSLLNAFSTREELCLLWAFILVVFFCLFIGYKTKVMQVLAALIVASMNGRILLIENGGYVVNNLLLLWTAFLPLGDRFSVDALLAANQQRRERTTKELNDRSTDTELWRLKPHVSLVCFVILLQLCAVYFFNVIHKTGPDWHNGRAVHYVLYVDRMANPLIGEIRNFIPDSLLLMGTKSTMGMEAGMTLALLCPIARVWAKRVAILFITILHLAFGTTFVLGPFAWALCVFSVTLFSREDWELAIKTMRRQHRARTVLFNRHSEAQLWFCRMLKRLDNFQLLTFQAKKGVSGLTIRNGRDVITGTRALGDVIAALPVGPLIAAPVRLFAMAGIGDTIGRAMGPKLGTFLGFDRRRLVPTVPSRDAKEAPFDVFEARFMGAWLRDYYGKAKGLSLVTIPIARLGGLLIVLLLTVAVWSALSEGLISGGARLFNLRVLRMAAQKGSALLLVIVVLLLLLRAQDGGDGRGDKLRSLVARKNVWVQGVGLVIVVLGMVSIARITVPARIPIGRNVVHWIDLALIPLGGLVAVLPLAKADKLRVWLNELFDPGGWGLQVCGVCTVFIGGFINVYLAPLGKRKLDWNIHETVYSFLNWDYNREDLFFWAGLLVAVLGAHIALTPLLKMNLTVPAPVSAKGRRIGVGFRELFILLFFCGAINQALIELWVARPLKMPQPSPVRELAHKMRYLQGWFMFSPNPVKDDGTIVTDAITVDGRRVDPFSIDAMRTAALMPPDFDLPGAKSFGYNQIWSDYYNRMHMPANSQFRKPMEEYIFRLQERTGNPNDTIVKGKVYWVHDINPIWAERRDPKTGKKALVRFTESTAFTRKELFSFKNPDPLVQDLYKRRFGDQDPPEAFVPGPNEETRKVKQSQKPAGSAPIRPRTKLPLKRP